MHCTKSSSKHNFRPNDNLRVLVASTKWDQTVASPPRQERAQAHLSPVAPVLLCRSEPARSTRLSLPTRMWSPRSSLWLHSTTMQKMEWFLEEARFIMVEPTDRFFLPAFRKTKKQ